MVKGLSFLGEKCKNDFAMCKMYIHGNYMYIHKYVATCSLVFSLQHSFFLFPPHSQLLSSLLAAEVSWLMATSPSKTGKTFFTKPSFQALKSSSRPTGRLLREEEKTIAHIQTHAYHIFFTLYTSSNPKRSILLKFCSLQWHIHVYTCVCTCIAVHLSSQIRKFYHLFIPFV